MISPSASSALITTTTIIIVIVIAPMLGADCMREFSSLPHTISQVKSDVCLCVYVFRVSKTAACYIPNIHHCCTRARAGSSWSWSSHSFVVATGLARGGWRARSVTRMIPQLLNTIDSRRFFAGRAGMCGRGRTFAEPVCLSVLPIPQGCSRVMLVERDGEK